MVQMCKDQGLKSPDLPEVIEGHAWFMYVDPGVDYESMVHISETIDQELKFMLNTLTPAEDADKDAGDECENRKFEEQQ